MGKLRSAAARVKRVLRRPGIRPIYLVSAAGQPNYGDELITRAWLSFLATERPDVPVWLDCPEPGRAAHLFAPAHPKLRTTNTLWQLAHLPTTDDDWARTIDTVVRDLGSPKLDAGLSALREVRSIHLLGGGYVTEIWPRHIGLVMGMVAFKRHFKIPLFATGQGWLPQNPRSADWLRTVVDEFDYIEARDIATATDFGVPLGLDDAFLALAVPPKKQRLFARSAPEVMLLVQGDFGEDIARADALAVIRRFLDEHGDQKSVGVVEAIPPEDSWLLPEIRQIRPDAQFFSFGEVWSDGFPAKKGQRWLTTRFHAHLMAAAAGAAGTAISFVPDYYDIKHTLLLDNGTGWSFSSTPEVISDPLPTPGIAKDFPKIARDNGKAKRALARKLYPR